MDYFLNKMKTKYNYKHKFTPEEIIGWIVIALMIATAIWMLLGSPTEIGAIIGIFGFTATSEILLWKRIFSIENNFNSKLSKIDKNTSLGFMKVKHDLSRMENKIINKLNNIENRIK